MAFKDLDEALGELGYAGTWQDQAKQSAINLEYQKAAATCWAAEHRRRTRRVGLDPNKFAIYQAAYQPIYQRDVRGPARIARRAAEGNGPRLALPGAKVNTCGHAELRHVAKGMCKACYNRASRTK